MILVFFSFIFETNSWFWNENFHYWEYDNHLLYWSVQGNYLNISANSESIIEVDELPQITKNMSIHNIKSFLSYEVGINFTESEMIQKKMKIVNNLKSSASSFNVKDISSVFYELPNSQKTEENFYNFEVEKKSHILNIIKIDKENVTIKVKTIRALMNVRKAILHKKNVSLSAFYNSRFGFSCNFKPKVINKSNSYIITRFYSCDWKCEAGMIVNSQYEAYKWEFDEFLNQSEVNHYFELLGKEIDHKMVLRQRLKMMRNIKHLENH
ncbi:hypothetical protein TRFO_03733 [Tritrichomonas foetus]|uniref:Uncharacterized protein n=1 Tax=Tritrichomonas foetus TaxID=1144522 RepID=A0A1J4KLL4_9EUKA|nr:hypothetical protein TRFO_03733 [Tritrichomonas foetus]|eukprot:OHT12107.1 hypothetical protein TRFO_03733 [Tritrichomonas foetus]